MQIEAFFIIFITLKIYNYNYWHFFCSYSELKLKNEQSFKIFTSNFTN